jgi:hypothetical protein
MKQKIRTIELEVDFDAKYCNHCPIMEHEFCSCNLFHFEEGDPEFNPDDWFQSLPTNRNHRVMRHRKCIEKYGK